VFLFELADLNTFAFVAPELRAQWHLSVADIGLVTSLGFGGMFFGSAVGGRLSDVFGRKQPVIWSSVTFSLFSVLSAFTSNLLTLGVLRVLTGVGLTAMTAIALTYVSEMYPSQLRGRCLAVIFGAGLAGIPLVAWFARLVVPSGPDGWRWVFVAGGFGVVVAALMARWLPESIRWQLAHGWTTMPSHWSRSWSARPARSSHRRLAHTRRTPTAPARGRPSELFNTRHRRRTIVFFLVSVFALLGFYGYTSFAPTLLVEHGFTVAQSLTYTSVVMLGAIPGALLAWLFIDRWERKHSLGVLTY